MSRVGKMPITVPSGVTVDIAGGNVTVKGPKGQLNRSVPTEMNISLEKDTLTVTRPSESKRHRAFHGLTRSLLANMVEGVSKGFEKNLEIVGVGYRAEKAGEKLILIWRCDVRTEIGRCQIATLFRRVHVIHESLETHHVCGVLDKKQFKSVCEASEVSTAFAYRCLCSF